MPKTTTSTTPTMSILPAGTTMGSLLDQAASCLLATASLYNTQRARFHRLALAKTFAEAGVPADAKVTLTTWEDEPNEDGTYDVDPGEVIAADGEILLDLGGNGALPAGNPGGVTTDYDIFLDGTDEYTGERLISAAKVYDWVTAGAR
jgi:hypothetical protein